MSALALADLEAYVGHGWHLVPLRPRSKQPLIAEWPEKASGERAVVEEWRQRWHEANMAIATGPSGLAVVDIDGPGGEALLERILDGQELPATPEVTTARGRHLYFRDPGDLTKSAEGGLDLQVGRAFVVAPPSVHPDGHQYAWAPGRDPEAVEVAAMPAALAGYFRLRRRTGGGDGRIPEGERNETLTRIAGKLRREGLERDAIETRLRALNLGRCTPPLDEHEVAAIAESVARYPKSEPAQTDGLIALGQKEFELGLDEHNEAIAVPLVGARIALSFGNGPRGLAARLRRRWVEETGKAPNASALATAVATLEAYAHDAAPRGVGMRVARPAPAKVVIDLGTADGSCVVVGPEGWQVAPRAPGEVVFRRTALTHPLPQPRRGGDLQELRGLLNLSDADWGLLRAWMVAALLADVPHPILLLAGEQGTGKSRAAKLATELLDPSAAPLRTPPRNVEDWCVAAAASWVVTLDNLSYLSQELTDALCRAVTGDSIVRRALFTNSDVSIATFRRPVVLTSIDPGALRGDLSERMLRIELERIEPSQRRTEGEVLAAFSDARPRLVGALLDLLAKVLAALPDTQVEAPPRMADFARVVAALDSVLGTTALAAYRARVGDTIADVIDGDALASCVRELMRSNDRWRGTPDELLARLTGLLGGGQRPRSWPGEPAALGKRMKNLAPALREVGIEFEVKRDRRGRRYHLRVTT